ncbi:adenylyl-sulfate kinase [Paraburkholderia panacisoli]|uniref:adenylyl-sulfate kinase n=1 Tax=Paraburkholderia panacisoli TaxID=2603818 RepID=UPI0024825AFB|nr:adenylyl-sulfate kinase [Paraburkholderia panacisoli]
MKPSYYAGNVIWLTGLSGSGKSTIAKALLDSALERSVRAVVLDGDELRKGLNADLGVRFEGPYREFASHCSHRQVVRLGGVSGHCCHDLAAAGTS